MMIVFSLHALAAIVSYAHRTQGTRRSRRPHLVCELFRWDHSSWGTAPTGPGASYRPSTLRRIVFDPRRTHTSARACASWNAAFQLLKDWWSRRLAAHTSHDVLAAASE
eukprot:2430126-Pleurochrysis_carterae.AAC.1